MTGKKFAFGKNWQEFLNCLNAGRFQAAQESLSLFLGRPDLKNFSFLDIGCGSSGDIGAEEVKKIFGEKVHGLVGKTTLAELCWIIKNATILLSNETSAPHLAVAMDVPVVLIYNGNHFGRFTPYPEETTDKYTAVCHPEIEKNLENYQKLSNRPGYASDLDIKEISPERVIRALDARLANGKS